MYDFLDKIGLKAVLEAIKGKMSEYASKALYGDTTINVGRKAGSAVGAKSTAEGVNTTASGIASHAEGSDTTASGSSSHAEGTYTEATGHYSHAEGDDTVASGSSSHAEGYQTYARGNHSHAEGVGSTADGDYSHAGGFFAKTTNDNEFACGTFNQSNEDTLFSVGDGTLDNTRHNAFEITKTGGKLHDKDIATTDLIPTIPTSLPANGGNADTVGGKVPEKIFYDNGFAADLNGATQSGCYATSPDTLNVPFSTWWLVDTTNYNNQFIVQKAHTIGNTAHTVSYIRNYANNAWSEWEEISTTPIKSITFSATADGTGNFNLWAPSENKVPISIQLDNKTFYAVPFLYNNQVWLGSTISEVTRQPVPNTTVSGTIYYIEV